MVMLKQFADRINKLIDSSQLISTIKPKSIRRKIWSYAGIDDDRLDSLRHLAASGRRLNEVTNSLGWKDILELKIHSQAIASQIATNPNVNEQLRFKAACEYQAIEGLFIEINNRIKRAKEADRELEKV